MAVAGVRGWSQVPLGAGGGLLPDLSAVCAHLPSAEVLTAVPFALWTLPDARHTYFLKSSAI